MTREPAFAVWITGLPASGKSTVTRALADALAARGLDAAILESDVVRDAIMPGSGYDAGDRQAFYDAMVWVGELLVRHGVPVVFDATANRRSFRDGARRRIVRFMEVWIDTPLEVCMERDPKGIYRDAKAGRAETVPGLGEPYEAPEAAEVVVHGIGEDAEAAASRILDMLAERGYIGEE